jgi:antitoxin ParD1/3/4
MGGPGASVACRDEAARDDCDGKPCESAYWPKTVLAEDWLMRASFDTISTEEGKDTNVPQGKRHSVDLTPDLENAIQRRLDSGAYQSEVEVIRAGLRALDRDEEEKAGRLAKLDASVARGLADADAGRVRASGEVFSELRERIERKVKARGR